MEDLSIMRPSAISSTKIRGKTKQKKYYEFLKPTSFSISWGIHLLGRNHKIKIKIAPICCLKAKQQTLLNLGQLHLVTCCNIACMSDAVSSYIENECLIRKLTLSKVTL